MKSEDMRLLNRREFNGLCVALGSFASPTGAAGLDAAAGAASTGAGRTAKFRDSTVVSALGQGSAGSRKGKTSSRRRSGTHWPFARNDF